MDGQIRHRRMLPASWMVRIARRLAVAGGMWLVAMARVVGDPTVVSPGGSNRAEATVDSVPAGRLFFERDIMPLLTARGCNGGGCHGKSGGQNGFSLSLFGFDPDGDYQAIMMQSRSRRVNEAAPSDSLLVLKGAAIVPHGGGRRLEPDGGDVRMLIDWIASGATRLPPGAAKLSHITISPQSRPLAAGESLRLMVTAHDTDGTSRDVTALAAFSSSEPVVADVRGDGLLAVGRLSGEATVMARFMGRIATWNATVPRPGVVDPAAWDRLPSNGFIDDLAWKQFRHLNILPSDECDDATFLRRAFLDAIGRLPRVDEARAFLVDTDPLKRAKLVDTIVARPEYADRWANVWADLLRPNPYRVGIKATLSLDTFLRDAFASNMPYDRFVSELLTATGSVWRNGAAVIYRDRRSPDEIVTIASQLFLGVRLECAKCHQHPFEVYGQRDFYGLAAYFGRVGQTGSLSPPISGAEESVFVKASGEVRHPLTSEVLEPAPPGGEPSAGGSGQSSPATVAIGEEDDPRRRLVEWLTGPGARTLAAAGVNRVWAELFGIGIVDPVDDFRATNPPINPELLAAVADAFRQSGYDHRLLVSTIMKSRLYGLSSIPNSTNADDHRHFSRRYRRRLRAEVLADAIDDVTGVPSMYPGTPPGTRATQVWTHRSGSTFLDVFGRPDPNQDPPCERIGDATVVQALHLMNSGQLHAKVTADDALPARLAAGETGSDGQAPAMDADGTIDHLYLAAFARLPSAEEKRRILPEFSREGVTRRQASEDLLWAMLNTPEFVYNR